MEKFSIVLTASNQLEPTPAFSAAIAALTSFLEHTEATKSDINDIVSASVEALSNAMTHAYKGKEPGRINFNVDGVFKNGDVHISVIDYGCGIEDLEQAEQPGYTTDPCEERSGMGFTIMRSFMDSCEVTTEVGKGTSVYLTKNILR